MIASRSPSRRAYLFRGFRRLCVCIGEWVSLSGSRPLAVTIVPLASVSAVCVSVTPSCAALPIQQRSLASVPRGLLLAFLDMGRSNRSFSVLRLRAISSGDGPPRHMQLGGGGSQTIACCVAAVACLGRSTLVCGTFLSGRLAKCAACR